MAAAFKANESFSANAGGSSLAADQSGVAGKGKEFSMEGSGSVKSSGGNVQIKGTEIHMDK